MRRSPDVLDHSMAMSRSSSAKFLYHCPCPTVDGTVVICHPLWAATVTVANLDPIRRVRVPLADPTLLFHATARRYGRSFLSLVPLTVNFWERVVESLTLMAYGVEPSLGAARK